MRLKYKGELKTIKQIFKAGVRLHKESYHTAKAVYVGLAFITVFTAVIPYLSNFLSGKIIDSLVSYVALPENISSVYYLILVFVILLVVERVAGSFYSYLDTVQWLRLYNYFSIKVASVMSKFDIAHHENKKYSDLIKKAQESFNASIVNFLSNSLGLISDIISIGVGFAVVFFISPFLFLIILLFSLPDFITDLALGKRKYGVWDSDTEIRRDYWQTNGYLDSEKYLKELKIFGSRNYLIKRLKNLLLGFQDRQLAVEKKRFVLGSGLSFISGLGFGLVYLLIVRQVIDGVISIGTFTFYVASVRALSGSISSLLRSVSRIYEEGLYTIDLYKLIDIKPLIKDGTISYNSNKAPLLEFKKVGFKYPFTKKYIFKDLSIKIKPGEHIAIVGENGAGKSTFVSLLSRFYDASEGKILINGTNVNSLKQDDWHKSLALLSQDFVRYHFDVKANIGIGNISKIDDLEGIKTAAQKSGASSFIEELDHKYDTTLSKRYKNGTELSTGQWQKIALARAFFKNSPILILDEPTSAIDPKAEYEIFEKLFDFAKDKTVIIISHRFSTVRNADRIIVLDDGKIIEEGSHKDLINLGGQYKEAFDLQKKGYDDI